jgi:hypothetical protein
LTLNQVDTNSHCLALTNCQLNMVHFNIGSQEEQPTSDSHSTSHHKHKHQSHKCELSSPFSPILKGLDSTTRFTSVFYITTPPVQTLHTFTPLYFFEHYQSKQFPYSLKKNCDSPDATALFHTTDLDVTNCAYLFKSRITEAHLRVPNFPIHSSNSTELQYQTFDPLRPKCCSFLSLCCLMCLLSLMKIVSGCNYIHLITT